MITLTVKSFIISLLLILIITYILCMTRVHSLIVNILIKVEQFFKRRKG